MRGNPQAVLDAIDEFGRTKKYLMNIGEYKSKTVVDRIRQHRPETFVECGAYIGYSAVAFGAAVKEAGGKRYWSLEHNAEFAAVTTMLVDLAGLSDLVKVVVGDVSDSVTRLYQEKKLTKIDFLFLDHLKHMYTPDLKLCEELGLVGPGSVYAADNGKLPFTSLSTYTVEAHNSPQWSNLGTLSTSTTSGAALARSVTALISLPVGKATRISSMKASSLRDGSQAEFRYVSLDLVFSPHIQTFNETFRMLLRSRSVRGLTHRSILMRRDSHSELAQWSLDVTDAESVRTSEQLQKRVVVLVV